MGVVSQPCYEVALFFLEASRVPIARHVLLLKLPFYTRRRVAGISRKPKRRRRRSIRLSTGLYSR